MVTSAQRDGELVADLSPEGAALHEAEVVGVCGLSSADQAGVGRDKLDMIAVAMPSRLWQRQNTLIDRLCPPAAVLRLGTLSP